MLGYDSLASVNVKAARTFCEISQFVSQLNGSETTWGWVNDEAAFNKIRSANYNKLKYILGYDSCTLPVVQPQKANYTLTHALSGCTTHEMHTGSVCVFLWEVIQALQKHVLQLLRSFYSMCFCVIVLSVCYIAFGPLSLGKPLSRLTTWLASLSVLDAVVEKAGPKNNTHTLIHLRDGTEHVCWWEPPITS